MLSWLRRTRRPSSGPPRRSPRWGRFPPWLRWQRREGVSVQQGPPAQQQGGGWGQQQAAQQAPDFYSKQQPQDWQPRARAEAVVSPRGAFRTGTGKNNKPLAGMVLLEQQTATTSARSSGCGDGGASVHWSGRSARRSSFSAHLADGIRQGPLSGDCGTQGNPEGGAVFEPLPSIPGLQRLHDDGVKFRRGQLS